MPQVRAVSNTSRLPSSVSDPSRRFLGFTLPLPPSPLFLFECLAANVPALNMHSSQVGLDVSVECQDDGDTTAAAVAAVASADNGAVEPASAPSAKAVCKFGDKCTRRRNLAHRAKYHHTPRGQRSASGGNRSGSRSAPASRNGSAAHRGGRGGGGTAVAIKMRKKILKRHPGRGAPPSAVRECKFGDRCLRLDDPVHLRWYSHSQLLARAEVTAEATAAATAEATAAATAEADDAAARTGHPPDDGKKSLWISFFLSRDQIRSKRAGLPLIVLFHFFVVCV